MISVSLVGNLGKAPQIFPERATFSVAVSQGKEEEPLWLNVVVFGKRASFLKEWETGDTVAVYGRLNERSWVDNEGNQRKSLQVIADGVSRVRWARNGESRVKKEEKNGDISF